MSEPLPPPGSPRGAYPSVLQVLGMLLGLLAVTIAGYIAVYAVAALLGREISADARGLVLVDILAWAAVLVWAFRRTRRPFRQVFSFAGFPPVALLAVVPAFVGGSIVLSEVDNVTRWFFPMPAFLAGLLDQMFERDPLSFLMLTVVGPANEELLFRGVVLGGFLRRYPVRTAVVGSALLFAVFHLNPYQFAGAFVAGIFLAWLFLRTRSLWLCIAVHGLYNFYLWLLVHVVPVEIAGFSTALPLADGPIQFQPLWFDLLGIVLAVAGFLAVRRRLG